KARISAIVAPTSFSMPGPMWRDGPPAKPMRRDGPPARARPRKPREPGKADLVGRDGPPGGPMWRDGPPGKDERARPREAGKPPSPRDPNLRAASERIVALLTPEQAKRWREMT